MASDSGFRNSLRDGKGGGGQFRIIKMKPTFDENI
jgi:hypothetical protein